MIAVKINFILFIHTCIHVYLLLFSPISGNAPSTKYKSPTMSYKGPAHFKYNYHHNF